MILTKGEFLDWKGNPTTQYFFKALKNSREILKEEYVLGLYEEAGKVEGKAQLLRDLIEMDYETLQEIAFEKL